MKVKNLYFQCLFEFLIFNLFIYLFNCLYQTPRSIDRQWQGITTQDTKAEHHEKRKKLTNQNKIKKRRKKKHL